MNKCVFIGNLTKEPEPRSLSDGTPLCNFTIAVNGRKKEDVDFIRVTAWKALGENCAKYLHKGRKVAVVGSVSAGAYTGNDGKPVGTLEIRSAESVEFLSAMNDGAAPAAEPAMDSGTGYAVVEESELPF